MTGPKTLRDQTYAAAKSYTHDTAVEVGYITGAITGPPIKLAIEQLERIAALSNDLLATAGAKWALEQLKEARR